MFAAKISTMPMPLCPLLRPVGFVSRIELENEVLADLITFRNGQKCSVLSLTVFLKPYLADLVPYRKASMHLITFSIVQLKVSILDPVCGI